MRERLIDLLTNDLHRADNPLQFTSDETVERLADMLIENGVIVPPCKVGDKVYIISRNKVKECEVIFVGLSADEKCSYFNFVEKYTDGVFYKSHSMVFAVIGKSVFLTREEAEQALEGGVKE